MSDRFKIILLLGVVFIVAVIAWYAPVMFKGYATMEMWNSSVLARNYAQSNVFGVEDKLNVFLAPSLVEEQTQISTEGGKLTSIILAQVFKLIGIPEYQNLIFISIAILALALLIFTITVYYLFNLKTAALFAFIYMLLPFNWSLPYHLALYEFALLFFSLFCLFYFLGQRSQGKYRFVATVCSGAFLALAGMARETMLVIAPVVFIYLLLKKEKKQLLCFFIPLLLILSLFWLPATLSENNTYRTYFLKDQSLSDESTFRDWDFICHFYPDPYTYHFAKQEHLENYYDDLSSADLDFLDRISLVREASNVGLKKPGLLDGAKLRFVLLARHIFRFLAIEEIGGPIIFLLLIFGFIFLKKERKPLYRFFVFWFIFVVFFLSFILMGGRSHLIDFGWAIALIVALGLLFLIKTITQYFQLKKKSKIIIGFLLALLVLYNLVLAGHVLWGRIYDQPHHLKILAYAQAINQLKIADEDVIAIGLDEFKINKLNYLAPKSMVIFAPETLAKLIKEDKLQSAFDKFRVKYILGYSDELTSQVLAKSKVINIASDSLPAPIPETSQTKGWLMNLIK